MFPDRPVSWIFIAPSVSPKRTSGGANNPGLRLYKFDTDTGQVSSVFVKDTQCYSNLFTQFTFLFGIKFVE